MNRGKLVRTDRFCINWHYVCVVDWTVVLSLTWKHLLHCQHLRVKSRSAIENLQKYRAVIRVAISLIHMLLGMCLLYQQVLATLMHCRYTNTYNSNYISITAACRVKEFFHGFRLKTLQICSDGALTTRLFVNVDNSRRGSRIHMEDAFLLTKFYNLHLAINTYFLICQTRVDILQACPVRWFWRSSS